MYREGIRSSTKSLKVLSPAAVSKALMINHRSSAQVLLRQSPEDLQWKASKWLDRLLWCIRLSTTMPMNDNFTPTWLFLKHEGRLFVFLPLVGECYDANDVAKLLNLICCIKSAFSLNNLQGKTFKALRTCPQCIGYARMLLYCINVLH
jgi:hypothetical protein